MKRYWNIYEKIYDLENLKEAHKQARKDKQLYREVKMVNASEEYFLKKIQKLLKERKYCENLNITHTVLFSGRSCYRLKNISCKYSQILHVQV